MKGKVKDFFDNPASFHINNNGVFDFGMSDIPKGRIGKGAFSRRILGVKCGFDLAAGVLGKPFVEQRLFGKGKDKQAEIQYSCGFVAGWLPKS